MTDPRTMYEAMSLPALRNIIARAITEHSLPASWKAPKTTDNAELVEHINEMCNEFGITPNEKGILVKSTV